MPEIFSFTDGADDTLTITGAPAGAHAAVMVVEINDDNPVLLSETAVTELRKALLPFDPEVGATFAEEYQRGRQDAIDDNDLVTRDDFDAVHDRAWTDGYNTAMLASGKLDAQRVAALEKAAEVAGNLRGNSLGGPNAASHETVLAYALFLLDLLPMPAAR